jgi:hypothetical protein
MQRSTMAIWMASLLTCAAAAVAGARDEAVLNGCWRSQQVRILMSDESLMDLNNDCVTEYMPGRARLSCQGSKQVMKALWRVEVPAPGQMTITPIDKTGKPTGGKSQSMRFAIQDDWLLIDRDVVVDPVIGHTAKHAVNVKTVSLHEKAGCAPRGDTGFRGGHGSVSSLALALPEGWTAARADPVKDKDLATAVGSNIFIGRFQRAGAGGDADPAVTVLVTDSVQDGAVPVRADGFAGDKQRFAADLVPPRLSCDLPDRACGTPAPPEGMQAYTELLNVRGRVARVTATTPDAPGAQELLRKSVEAFVEQLRKDNAG